MNDEKNNNLMIADRLKQQADHILYTKGVDALLRQCGQVVYTGSYSLDLMVWPDIDIYLIPNTPSDYEYQLFHLGKMFLNYPELLSIKLERNFQRRHPKCPEGHYLQIKLDNDYWQSPWKLDIWIITPIALEQKLAFIEQVKQRLTPKLKQLILEIKQSLITQEGRTPAFSGYYIYQAILFEGIFDINKIYAYLKKHGIQLPKK